MALAWRAGGMPGSWSLAAAAAGLTAAILLHYAGGSCPASMPSWRWSWLWPTPRRRCWPVRICWPGRASRCGAAALSRARANRAAPSFWLLPVMLLWVNLHGSFMIGLMLPSAFMIEALFDPAPTRRTVATWAGFILAAWAVALLNPDFLAGALFPIHLVGHAQPRLDRRVAADRFQPPPAAGAHDPGRPRPWVCPARSGCRRCAW